MGAGGGAGAGVGACGAGAGFGSSGKLPVDCAAAGAATSNHATLKSHKPSERHTIHKT